MLPVWFEPAAPATTYSGSRPLGNTSARVRSFDKEAAAGGGSATYTWATIKPGTYLYSSGTHPQVQVQMGLYGAMTKDAGRRAGGLQPGRHQRRLHQPGDAALQRGRSGAARRGRRAARTASAAARARSNTGPSIFLINGKPYPDAEPGAVHHGAAGAGVVAALAQRRPEDPRADAQRPVLAGGRRRRQSGALPCQSAPAVHGLPAGRQNGRCAAQAGQSEHHRHRCATPSSTAAISTPPTARRAAACWPSSMSRRASSRRRCSIPLRRPARPSGSAYQYLAHATADGRQSGAVFAGVAADAAAGMTINSSTGLLTWTPASARQLCGDGARHRHRGGAGERPKLHHRGRSMRRRARQPRAGGGRQHATPRWRMPRRAARRWWPRLACWRNDSDVDGNPLTAVSPVRQRRLRRSPSPRVALNANGGFR